MTVIIMHFKGTNLNTRLQDNVMLTVFKLIERKLKI